MNSLPCGSNINLNFNKEFHLMYNLLRNFTNFSLLFRESVRPHRLYSMFLPQKEEKKRMYCHNTITMMWRRSGFMVIALVSGSRSGRGQCAVFLGKTLISHGAYRHPGIFENHQLSFYILKITFIVIYIFPHHSLSLVHACYTSIQ